MMELEYQDAMMDISRALIMFYGRYWLQDIMSRIKLELGIMILSSIFEKWHTKSISERHYGGILCTLNRNKIWSVHAA